MGFQYRGEMSSGSMFNKSSSGSGNLFGSDWDPLENFGSFGSGCFSEMVNPFANINPECGSSSSPNNREKRRFNFNPNTNGEREEKNDGCGNNPSENDLKKQKIDSRNRQMGAPKEDYIHVRAKRGQATNSHSLAERVRRERISERMKLLQELVPGCNKITGKAVMLDEIINYVQSLQHQVEFLSMKLATVNPELNIDIDSLVFKDVLQSRGSSSNPAFGFGPTLSSSHSYPHGSLPGISTATMHPIHPQSVWDNDLHNLLQMRFDANTAINNLGPNGNHE